MAGIILCLLCACERDHHTNPVVPKGNLPIQMNLEPAFNLGFNVTQVTVQITKGEFTASQNLVIAGNAATGTFTDLEPGTYAINVSVYQNALLIATGTGTGTVSPGQNTTVHITLQFVPGGLEVVVNWGLPYAECRRVLFVGNSHTYYNNGVDYHVQQLLNAVHHDWNAVIQNCTMGGYTLENHFNDQNTLATIANGDWDLVILQEQSSRPMNDPDLFYTYATRLDSVITASGALTGFYMTWAWRNNPEMYVPIRDAYNYIGAYLDALVAPCGIAYHNSMATDSTIVLYDTDNYHPSLYGTYLVACVFLASIWNINPMDNPYQPDQISPAIAAYLQQVAWQTVSSYHNTKLERKIEQINDCPRQYLSKKEDIALPLAM